MIEACPTCLGYVFSEIQATVEYYTKLLKLKLGLCCYKSDMLKYKLAVLNFIFVPKIHDVRSSGRNGILFPR